MECLLNGSRENREDRDSKRCREGAASSRRKDARNSLLIGIPFFEENAQVGPTHDHRFVKKFIPQQLRIQRKLSKIENGLSTYIPIMPRSFVPISTKVDRWWQIKRYPSLFIRGGVEKVEQMGRKIYRLSESALGGEFLERLTTLSHRVELEIVEKEGLTQVIVQAEGNDDFDDSFMPLEWCSFKKNQKIKEIFDVMERGDGFIRIDPTHPQKEAILHHFIKLSMRPIGRELLIEISLIVHNFIMIIYNMGNNQFHFSKDPANGSIIIFDEVEGEYKLASIGKHNSQPLPIPRDPTVRLGHELIHALHSYRCPDKALDPIKEASFDPVTTTFVLPIKGESYKHYTDL